MNKDDVKKRFKEWGATIPKCGICGAIVNAEDIQNNKFEYAKSKYGEHFAHTKCLKKLIVKK